MPREPAPGTAGMQTGADCQPRSATIDEAARWHRLSLCGHHRDPLPLVAQPATHLPGRVATNPWHVCLSLDRRAGTPSWCPPGGRPVASLGLLQVGQHEADGWKQQYVSRVSGGAQQPPEDGTFCGLRFSGKPCQDRDEDALMTLVGKGRDSRCNEQGREARPPTPRSACVGQDSGPRKAPKYATLRPRIPAPNMSPDLEH